MNDDTNKEVSVNPVEGIQDNFKIETKPVEVKQPEVVEQPAPEVVLSETVVDTPVVEVTSENAVEVTPKAVEETKTEEVVVENTAPIVSETVISADVNTEVKNDATVLVGTIDEVSVTVDSNSFNTLDENEISDKSVFKNNTTTSENTVMKEGMENQVQKKGFPFFMVFIFILVVFFAFFIDDISVWVKEYKESKSKQPNTEEKEESKEENKKDEEDKTNQARVLTLSEIDEAMNNSSLLFNFEAEKNIEVTSILEADKITYTTTNYIDVAGSAFKVEYTLENNILVAVADSSNSDFARQMSIILVKEIAKLQGVTSTDIDRYVLEKCDTNKIDNGFEFIKNEDGSSAYKIATNIKVDINK